MELEMGPGSGRSGLHPGMLFLPILDVVVGRLVERSLATITAEIVGLAIILVAVLRVGGDSHAANGVGQLLSRVADIVLLGELLPAARTAEIVALTLPFQSVRRILRHHHTADRVFVCLSHSLSSSHIPSGLEIRMFGASRPVSQLDTKLKENRIEIRVSGYGCTAREVCRARTVRLQESLNYGKGELKPKLEPAVSNR